MSFHRRSIGVICACLWTSAAFAQQLSVRDLSLGVGSVAAANETGEGIAAGLANEFATNPQVGADVIYMSSKSKFGESDGETKATILVGQGRFPISKVVGIGVRASAITYDTTLGGDLEGSDKKANTELALTGGATFNTITAGLELGYVMHNESSKYEFASTGTGTAGGSGSSESSGSTSYIDPALGIAGTLVNKVRLAFTYKPELKHWFDTKTKSNFGGTSTEGDSKSAAIHGHQFALGAQIPVKEKASIYAGIERDTPLTAEHDDGDGSKSTISYDGNTTIAVGGEIPLGNGITPRGSISNRASPDSTTRIIAAGLGIAIGKKLNAGGLLGYEMFSKEKDGGQEGSGFIAGASFSASF